MNEVELFYQSGQTKQTYPELLSTLGISLNNITGSWYEPQPNSLIGSGHNSQTLMPLLRQGKPVLPANINYFELMLFFKQGGIVITPKADNWRYFCFSEQPFNSINLSPLTCKRQSSSVLLRNAKILEDQFNLKLADELKKTIPESLQLIQYYHENICIAWTLQNQEVNHV